MANAFADETAHSAQFFGDWRDHWFHDDYLALLRARWQLGEARSVLEVGSGAGHWSRVLTKLAHADASLVGIDREPRWVEAAAARADAAGLGDRLRYEIASADALPFPDDCFDLVSCQTVLIHCQDPASVLREMVRVTRPGGRVLVAEPNNLSGPFWSPAALTLPVAQLLTLVELHLRCERGKRARGEGDNSLGEALPALFLEAGLAQIEVRVNDRAAALIPPYDAPGDRAWIEDIEDGWERRTFLWDEPTTRAYFLAGGGDPQAFDAAWARAGEVLGDTVAGLRAGTWAQAGGSHHYLVCGVKPARSGS